MHFVTKYRRLCLAAAALAVPSMAQAQVNGFYMSLGGGYNIIDPVTETQAYSGPLKPSPGFEINVGNRPGAPFYGNVGPTYFRNGPVALGSFGYGFDNSIRAELEFSYTSNGVKRLNNGLTPDGLGTEPLGLAYSGNEKKYSFMGNVIYDFNDLSKRLGSPITPYIGGGVGLAIVDWKGVTRRGAGEDFTAAGLGVVQSITNAFHTTDTALAFQAIIGASYEIPGVPGLALTTDFRAVSLPGGYTQKSVLTLNFRPTPTPQFPQIVGAHAFSNWSSETNYRFMVGLRYAFGAPAAAATAPVPAPAAAAPVARSYVVFFDWDKATLTDRARQIVAEAAQTSAKVQATRIETNGHTDSSGTPAYNKGLSVRRAEAVAAELVQRGVAKELIVITGFGETRPLLPTAANVREPQNRRVEIIIK
ncbi:MAG: OmpA family protein [Paracraurococcus sp.]